MEIAQRYEALQKELASRYPNLWEEALELGRKVADPSTANAEMLWTKIWDKPLYTNTTVAIANSKKAQLLPEMHGAWKEMAKANGLFVIEQVGKGFKKSSFNIAGDRARHIVEHVPSPTRNGSVAAL
jgi:hypothetical protein